MPMAAARNSSSLPSARVRHGPELSLNATPNFACGTVVTITGSNLAGTTTVSFGGTNATTITPVSATQLKATVPAGAHTGPLQVTNPAGTGGLNR